MAKSLVVDANILIRAVLGVRAHSLIEAYAEDVTFLSVEEAFEDAEKYVPKVIKKFGGDEAAVSAALEKLRLLRRFVSIIPLANLGKLEQEARELLRGRDEDDWLYLALAHLFDCPIWTEDTDFFGTGIAVWTSDRVEVYLKR